VDAINLSLLILLTGFACITAFSRDLIRAAICLAFMSALLAVLLYRMNSPFAAVFELSVVAGLITVLFVSTIALTKEEEGVKEAKWPVYLFPLLLVLFGLIDVAVMKGFFSSVPQVSQNGSGSFGAALWGIRSIDLLGQVAVIFGGVFGVLALLREKPLSPEEARESEKAKQEGGILW
jgi:NADH-quinone oxidoreductase subunit J